MHTRGPQDHAKSFQRVIPQHPAHLGHRAPIHQPFRDPRHAEQSLLIHLEFGNRQKASPSPVARTKRPESKDVNENNTLE